MKPTATRASLPQLEPDLPAADNLETRRKNGLANKLGIQDRAFHDWYRFVLSFPPHLVRDYIDKFGLSDQQVLLDPFCGTGTTLVESKWRGLSAVGRRQRALGIVQIEQDMALCAEKFPDLVCRSIAAQAMPGEVIALFEFEKSDDEIRVTFEKHYRLVPPDELSPKELKEYQKRPL